MRTILRVIMIIAFIAVLSYIGITVYGNFFNSGSDVNVQMPSGSQARYSLVVKNTATVILTNDYEEFGDEVGNRTYLLHGYWELVGSEFRYYDSDIVLSEQIFGEIVLKRR